jgi:hypothetical protein
MSIKLQLKTKSLSRQSLTHHPDCKRHNSRPGEVDGLELWQKVEVTLPLPTITPSICAETGGGGVTAAVVVVVVSAVLRMMVPLLTGGWMLGVGEAMGSGKGVGAGVEREMV